MQLSCGPWTYNRFNDFDKALDPKTSEELQEGKGLPPWLKDKKDDKKSDKKDDCECKHSDDKKKEDKKDDDKGKPPWLKKEDLEASGLFSSEEIETLLEKMSPEEKAEKREERKKEKEYAEKGESKSKSDEIRAAEVRQKEKDKPLGKTKQLKRREMRKGEGLGVKPAINRAGFKGEAGGGVKRAADADQKAGGRALQG